MKRLITPAMLASRPSNLTQPPFRYRNNSCLGNKYANCKHIFGVKTAKTTKSTAASFSGFVYDDKSKPLSGIKLSIGRTNIITTTDTSGKFELGNIPPGRIDLFVDGRTFNPTNDTTKPQYPSLHFEAYAVKGRDNQIAHPIYLPALSTSPDSVKTVGGNEDVILKIPGLAGFQMKVKANSVTFPDGSRVGTLIVSPVTADKLPMSPPAGGAQFGVPAWTIQPAGTRFDPPIEVTLPNASSQPVGDNLPIVQWDHDLGQYVAMGRATVSEDGSVLITDSGSGITKAGWGGLCRYDPDKCGKTAPPKCHQCQDLVTLGDCPECKDKEPCKPDPLEEKASAEFPKKSLIKEKVSSLIRKVPFISTLNVDIQASGERKTGKGCCSKPSIFEKCLGPFSYEEVSGKGELSIDVGVGPSVLNWNMPDKIVYWGQDRWRATLKTKVSVAKVAAKGIAEAKTKTTACEGENCVSYSAQASAKLSLADVKLSGEVVLEEPEGRPSWNKWTVVLGGGATGTAAVNAGGIKASYSYSDGANCPSSGATEGKVEWDEVAAEIKAKVTAKVPGIIWPTGGYEWAWKYVIIEKGVF